MRLKYGVNKHNMPPQGYTFPRFITKETQKKFRKIIKHRQFHQETGFPIIHDQPYYGLPKELASTIDKHNWKTFAKHSANNNIYASIVQEFYSCILDRTQKYVLVRGFRVYFTPKYINFHYGLVKNLEWDDDVVDEYQDLKNTATEENLSFIMRTLTVEGADWKKENGKNILKVSWEALKPVPKVWYKFICARLLPSSDFENVDRDRLLLLHCILEGRSISVGKIIYDEIIDCAFKKKETDRLLFASLISDLCIRNGVHADDDDEVLMNQDVIELDSVKRFFKEEEDKRERFEEEKFVGGDEAFVRSVIFKHMQQKKKFWGFYKEAFIYQKKVFELNFEKGILNPPEFPDGILQPLMTDDPMHGQEKGKDPVTAEAEHESFVHDNVDDSKEPEARENEKRDSQSPASRFETKDESFVHDNGDDLKAGEKEKSDLSAAPSSESSSSRLQIKVKTCPSASLMANKKKRCYVDLSFDHEGNEEEEVVKIKQVHPVVKYSKKRFKTTAARRKRSKLNILL